MQRSFEVVRSRKYKSGVTGEDTNRSPTDKRWDSLVGDNGERQGSSGMMVLGGEEVRVCYAKMKERRRSRFREEFGDGF